MAGEILQAGDLGAESEHGYGQIPDTQVVSTTGKARYKFPSDYSIRVDGDALVVLDGEGDVAFVFAGGGWSAAFVAGAQVVIAAEDDD